MPIDGNSFFIYNKHYSKAKLAQYNTQLITFEPHLAADQIWIFEQKHGCYYIKNAYHDGYRLAKYGREDSKVTVYNGNYYNNQLWRLQKEGNYYRIYNQVYSRARLAKWGSRDSQVITYTGNKYDDQLWKLVPRYTATASRRVILSTDNRYTLFMPSSYI